VSLYLLVRLNHLLSDFVQLSFGWLQLDCTGLVFRQLAFELLCFCDEISFSGFELIAFFGNLVALFTQVCNLDVKLLDKIIFLFPELSYFNFWPFVLVKNLLAFQLFFFQLISNLLQTFPVLLQLFLQVFNLFFLLLVFCLLQSQSLIELWKLRFECLHFRVLGDRIRITHLKKYLFLLS
jgi:hypothetical protein